MPISTSAMGIFEPLGWFKKNSRYNATTIRTHHISTYETKVREKGPPTEDPHSKYQFRYMHDEYEPPYGYESSFQDFNLNLHKFIVLNKGL